MPRILLIGSLMVDRDIWRWFGNASTLTFSDQFIVDREKPCENPSSYTIRKRSILALGIEALRRAQVAKCMFQSV